MAQLLKGLPVSNALTEALTARAEALKEKNTVPTLAILRVGARPDDISYETGAKKRCDRIGIAVRQFLLEADCSREALLDCVRQINADPGIHGCLMLRPLPDRAMEEAACALLDPAKDVDCMTAGSLASVFSGKGEGFPPCTAEGCLALLDHYGIDPEGKNIAVIGRSLVIGRPVSLMLQSRNATVTMCHTKTRDMARICRNSEILVVAAGKMEMVDETFAAPGQVVIDVGIHADAEGKLRGDVCFDRVEPVVQAITPVPGGIGSVTTAILAKHVIEAAEKTV